MTIRQRLEKDLFDNGMFENDAKAIIAAYEQSELGAPMHGRLDDSLDSHPSQLFAVVWISVKKTALNWLNENAPNHWAKPMFEP